MLAAATFCFFAMLFNKKLEKLVGLAPNELGVAAQEQQRELAANRICLLRTVLSSSRMLWAAFSGYWTSHGIWAWTVLIFFACVRPRYKLCNLTHRLLLIPIIFNFVNPVDVDADQLRMCLYVCITRALCGLILTETLGEHLSHTIFTTMLAVHPAQAKFVQQAAATMIGGISIVLWTLTTQQRRLISDKKPNHLESLKVLVQAGLPTALLYIAWVLPHVPFKEIRFYAPKVGLVGVILSAILMVALSRWDVEMVTGQPYAIAHFNVRQKQQHWLNHEFASTAGHVRMLLSALLFVVVAVALAMQERLWGAAGCCGMILLQTTSPGFEQLTWFLRITLLVNAGYIYIRSFELGRSDKESEGFVWYCCLFCAAHTITSLSMLRLSSEIVVEILHIVSVTCIVVPEHLSLIWVFAMFVLLLTLSLLQVCMAFQAPPEGYVPGVSGDDDRMTQNHASVHAGDTPGEVFISNYEHKHKHIDHESSNCECDTSCTC